MSADSLTHYYHFSLGPVQSFVAQARRTRDFWAGSFILSWLSTVAMKAVMAQGGSIDFPQPDAGFLAALDGRQEDGPRQGNVPNRFMARVASAFDPHKVDSAVKAAWRELAEAVWRRDLAGLALPAADHRDGTRAIWDRQIAAFWDLQWVMQPAPDTRALDRIKNWRTHMPPVESGVMCMMMDGWQELSGAHRPGGRDSDPASSAYFWKMLRESAASGIATDLRPNEQLCAIAYVKRRFVRYFQQLHIVLPDLGVTLRGWKLPSAVPSVSYLAAAHWLAALLRISREDTGLRAAIGELYDKAYELTGERSEQDSPIRCVQEQSKGLKPPLHTLDGSLFFDATLENALLWGEKYPLAQEVLAKLRNVRHILRQRSRGTNEPAEPAPFYAVLLMDGDRLGAQMSDSRKQAAITAGLANFTRQANALVTQHNGFLIYAGGDDVLALLPLEDALPCAASLRAHYQSCFAGNGQGIETSLSAAVEFVHIKTPLGKILADAHQLLDEVAKQRTGRDAIACRVWNPGGNALEWAMSWDRALHDGRLEIERLAEDFRGQDEDEDAAAFANKFFYRIAARMDLLNPVEEDGEAILDEQQAVTLLAVDYINSGIAKARGITSLEEASNIISPLLAQCRAPVFDPSTGWRPSRRLRADGALLVRFLARKGADR